jgi:mRNA interferase MazF
MKEGDVVPTPIPQADGIIKNRPAVILRAMPTYNDFLVCGVSSQVRQAIAGFDELVLPTDNDFIASGLVTTSVIRLGFLVVLPSKNIAGSIGMIAPERHKRLLNTLATYISKET